MALEQTEAAMGDGSCTNAIVLRSNKMIPWCQIFTNMEALKESKISLSYKIEFKIEDQILKRRKF